MVDLKEKKSGGLAGIIAGDSAICFCGNEHDLLYRGYSIQDLAKHASFEEVSWLLTRGELPTTRELEGYQQALIKLRDVPDELKHILESVPKHTHPMDILRTSCSLLGNFEPESPNYNNLAIADRLIASLPSMLFYWRNFHLKGERTNLQTNEKTHAGHILKLMQGNSPDENKRRCLDTSLILYAEHEYNASTFTVRTIASTLADFYSAITGGIGALKGPLHGGANEAAMSLISQYRTPEEAEKGVLEKLKNKELIMGFGHRVYTELDPRSDIIKEWSLTLSKTATDGYLYSISEAIDKVMKREKKLFPNLDFYSATAYHFSGIPDELFTPLFVFSRIAGWSAHLIEQRSNNKLIRPNSNYIGPNLKKWIPHANRV